MNYAALLQVSCSVLSGCRQIIKEGITPNFRIDGRFCIARVIRVNEPISADKNGIAFLKVIITEEELHLIKPGVECEFFDGPQKVADCLINAVEEGPELMAGASP